MIEAKNLTKRFKKGVTAVDSINLKQMMEKYLACLEKMEQVKQQPLECLLLC